VPDHGPLLSRIPAGPKTPLPIPRAFHRLYDLAYNMWWSWDVGASDLWARLSPGEWARNRNPLSLLHMVPGSTWEALADDPDFGDLYADTLARFDAYLTGADTWYTRNCSPDRRPTEPVAYLCAEYGIHHKLRFYSGGLGILAGDHMKTASDLGIPIIGIGVFYRRGYFQQAVDPDGWQQHTYNWIEPTRRPIREVLDPVTGLPLRVQVELHGREVAVGAWRLDVGRVPVLLLDTDVPENDPDDRPITHILYVRGREMRFCQEAVLGVGGVRILEALGIAPAVWHVNEGHAALSLIERLGGELRTDGDVDAAIDRVKRSTLFTLHTPVAAGNEVYDMEVVDKYLSATVPEVDRDLRNRLATSHVQGPDRFDLGALAIRMSAITNGVSKRHGEVVTQQWGSLIGGTAEAITNGMHPETWLGRNTVRLLERTVGADWAERLGSPDGWEAIRDVPAKDLWSVHRSQKALMLRRIRARLRDEFARHGASPDRLRWVDDQLPEDRLTFVFARRFATYKRAGLVFSDRDRIRRILTDPARPVQIIFAGKAHPADRDGQRLIKEIVEISQTDGFVGHVFFVENYDMQLAHSLVTGADAWLNNPRPPLEASGTSGMKSAANGGLNVSILDGWWIEGFNGKNGWGIEDDAPDAADASKLYDVIEHEVVPRFYDRDAAGVPQGWVEMAKEAIVTALAGFSSHRMVIEYFDKAYCPLATGTGSEGA